jgi:hypothetical protein
MGMGSAVYIISATCAWIGQASRSVFIPMNRSPSGAVDDRARSDDIGEAFETNAKSWVDVGIAKADLAEIADSQPREDAFSIRITA